MRQKTKILFIFFVLLASSCSHIFSTESAEESLIRDLQVVEYWNRRLDERYPVMYNHLLQGGYFAMPSARMGEEGELGIGFSYTPPYHNYNLRCQILKSVEITGNYRVFRGIKDPVLSQFGFGDFSDKGANIKFSIISPEDSDYTLPGVAFGFDDFMGTKSFNSAYFVVTQILMDKNIEMSLGIGDGRIGGIFGAFQIMPFRRTTWTYLRMLAIIAEYDATPYHRAKREPHPKGRVKKSPINYGLKYRLWDHLDFSLSYIRGDALAFSASAFYDFGYTNGLLPKIDDCLVYKAPRNNECLGIRRSEEILVPELIFAFDQQAIDILEIYVYYNEWDQKSLRITILNDTYRQEKALRCRLDNLLGGIIPADIEEVIVVVNSDGFPVQQYRYSMQYVRQFADREMGSGELDVLTPLEEATKIDYYSASQLFKRQTEYFNLEFSPRTLSLFGSSSGKFKYSLGINAFVNGFFWNDIYYSILVGYTAISNINPNGDFDRLNPSQLINVRSDLTRYLGHKGLNVDQAYAQKNWALGRGWYARVAGGYFEVEYGGIAGEVLYYPLNGPWAIGLESAVLKKRDYTGLGFTNKIRKLDGFVPTWRKFTGSQYFLNLYYDLKIAQLEFKVSAGKFLANDWGVRNEITRYFPSGMRLSIWYTVTNGHDKINGQTYYDKGIYISMPFDIFYTHSERSRWGYGMSAWLRDVGVQAYTGNHLYELISDLRQ
jgi:hypothetical protein